MLAASKDTGRVVAATPPAYRHMPVVPVTVPRSRREITAQASLLSDVTQADWEGAEGERGTYGNDDDFEIDAMDDREAAEAIEQADEIALNNGVDRDVLSKQPLPASNFYGQGTAEDQQILAERRSEQGAQAIAQKSDLLEAAASNIQGFATKLHSSLVAAENCFEGLGMTLERSKKLQTELASMPLDQSTRERLDQTNATVAILASVKESLSTIGIFKESGQENQGGIGSIRAAVGAALDEVTQLGMTELAAVRNQSESAHVSLEVERASRRLPCGD